MNRPMHVSPRWICCLLGILFLSEPNIAFSDFFPDVIGYLLLLYGLHRLSALSDAVYDARTKLQVMMWVSFGATLLRNYLGSLPSTDSMGVYEQPTLLLLCSFLLLVLKWCYLLPAVGVLFGGLEALWIRHTDGEDELDTKKSTARTRFFLIASSILALLPECAVLSAEKTEQNMLRFVGLFRTVSLILSLILMFIWGISMLRFCLCWQKNKAFCKKLETLYQGERIARSEVFALRRLKFSFAFLIGGSVFLSYVRMDKQRLIPLYLFVLLSLICVGLTWNILRRQKKEKIAVLVGGTLLALCNVLSEVSEGRFLDRYLSLDAALYSTDAYAAYGVLSAIRISEAVLLLVFIALLLFLWYRFLCLELSVVYDGADAGEISKRATKRLHRTFLRRAGIAMALSGLYAVALAADGVLRLWVPWLWWVVAILSVSAAIGFVNFFLSLSEEMTLSVESRVLHKKASDAHTVSVISNDKKEYGNHAEQSESE